MGLAKGEAVSPTKTSSTLKAEGSTTPVTKAWLESRIDPLALKAMLAGES